MPHKNKLHGNARYDGFLRVEIGARNVDRWIVRCTILEALRRAYPQLHGRLLDVGCGKMPYRSDILSRSSVRDYVGLDLESALVYDAAVTPHARWDGKTIPFAAGSFDCAIATEVFEHAFDIDRLLLEIRRVLCPGATLFFTTPFLWPYHEMPYDAQRWTAQGLEDRLRKAGFRDIRIASEGNWHSSLAQFLGLWVARSGLHPIVRLPLRHLVFLAQKVLMRFDHFSDSAENAMPRQITGTASL